MHFDEPSRLAFERRQAEKAKRDLGRSGEPVLLSERLRAQEAVDKACAAEAAYWNAR